MTAYELRCLLESVDDSMEVYVEADHGQQPASAFTAGKAYICTADEHDVTEIHEDDLAEYDLDEIETVFLIGG